MDPLYVMECFLCLILKCDATRESRALSGNRLVLGLLIVILLHRISGVLSLNVLYICLKRLVYNESEELSTRRVFALLQMVCP